MKRASNQSVTIRIIVFFAVLFLGIFTLMAWWVQGIKPVNINDTDPIIFTIGKEEGVKSIVSRLAKENLIRSPTAFYILIRINGIGTQIQAGDFRLKRSMTAEDICMSLTHGLQDVWITLLEGWRSEEVAAKISKELDIPEGEIIKVSREGYLFPDTYLIPRDASAGAVVKILYDNFDEKITPEMREEGIKSGLTFEQIITLASIVEREGINDNDRPLIAGILLKRYKSDWPIQADATIQYILGYQSEGKTWWKKSISNKDKEIDSPFNTYINKNLPPSPISNPGLASILSVIYPKMSSYWYYIHDIQGQVYFAETLEEHNYNINTHIR